MHGGDDNNNTNEDGSQNSHNGEQPQAEIEDEAASREASN